MQRKLIQQLKEKYMGHIIMPYTTNMNSNKMFQKQKLSKYHENPWHEHSDKQEAGSSKQCMFTSTSRIYFPWKLSQISQHKVMCKCIRMTQLHKTITLQRNMHLWLGNFLPPPSTNPTIITTTTWFNQVIKYFNDNTMTKTHLEQLRNNSQILKIHHN